MLTYSKEQWECIRRRGWFRYLLFPYAINGLLMGVAVPVMNGLIFPPPHFDLLGKWVFSIPFFIAGWGGFGVYRWYLNEKKYSRSGKP